MNTVAPRGYDLGKRAAGVERTRRRIVHAAAALYEEQGIAATSMQQVARKAGVAAATVLNHFAMAEDLAEAVVEHLTASLALPSATVFDAAEDVHERVRLLARALAAFYERSEPLYNVYARDMQTVPALAEGAARVYASLDRLMRDALGPSGTDERVVAGALAVLGPAPLGQLRVGGMTTEEAADLLAEMLASWLNAAPAQSPSRTSKGHGKHDTRNRRRARD